MIQNGNRMASKKIVTSFDHEIAEKTAQLSVKNSAFDTLKEETKALEDRLVASKVTMKMMKDEMKEISDTIETLKKKQKEAQEQQRIEREAEEKLRKEIETKVREEMEIKKKVEEELQRMKAEKADTEKTEKKVENVKKTEKKVEKTEKTEKVEKADKADKKSKKKEESEPGTSQASGTSQDDTPQPKRKTIPKAVKSTLWNMHFTENNAKGDCKVCSKEIKMNDFEAGHIVAVANGGSDHLDNLMPVCGLCNRSMGTQNLNEFKRIYFAQSSPQNLP